MTTDEFIKSLNDKLAEITKENKPLALAVNSLNSVQDKRIFREGKNKTGNNIGEYKGGELYVSVAKSPKKFTPKGKPVTGKEIKDRKTGYFPNYLDYKKTIGKNKKVQSVDLMLSNDLQKDFARYAVKIDANNYVVSLKEENAVKVKRYGVDEVFGLSKKEKEQFIKVLTAELIKALK